jgi:hypothetical protein
MEDLKTDLNGQPGTVVVEPSVVEMTEAELANKIDTDVDFANDYLSGRLKVEPKAEPAAAAPAEPAAPKKDAPPAAEPAKTPEPAKKEESVVTHKDDGDYEVKFEDGSKIAYKSKNEMLKGVKEKENMLRRQRAVIQELKDRDDAQKAEIEELKRKTAAPAAPAEPPKPKTDPVPENPEAEVDLFDPEYQKNIRRKVLDQEKEIKDLKESIKADRAEREKDKVESKKRDEEKDAADRHSAETKRKYSDASAFISRPKFIEQNPGFKLERSIEIVDAEYVTFLKELGELAGTDGSMRQNVAIFDIYLDPVSEKGKTLKAEAEKIGTRPPADYQNYLNILHLLNKRDTLQKVDPVSGKMIPFTLEETHRYLKMLESDDSPAAGAPSPEPAKTELNPPADSPMAQALLEAEKRKKNVAADVPPGSTSAAVSYADMTKAQFDELMDMPVEKLRKDPALRAKWEGLFKHLGQTPPRLDGV